MSAQYATLLDDLIDIAHAKGDAKLADTAAAELSQLRAQAAELHAALHRIMELEAIVNKQNAVLLNAAEQEHPQ